MTDNHGEVQKVYVTPSGSAIIKCPDCEMVRTLVADKFRGAKHILNVKCSCKNIFRVNLEFRKFYRKPTNLPGKYVLLPEKIHHSRTMVANISQGGVCFHILGGHQLGDGQEIQVCFSLDDHHRSEIDRQAVVRFVEKNNVGCAFTDNSSAPDKALGFYLMV